MIYNNSCIAQKLNRNLPTDRFILVNNCIDELTKKTYTNLGDIYRDAVKYIPEDVDVINFSDDDDIFLPNHIEEGVKGLIRGGKTAYKPEKSYFKQRGRTILIENVLEPSIFVKKDHVLQYGFSNTSTPQHHQWLQPLIDSGDIYADPKGIPTLIYDWSQEIPTFKTSGDPLNPKNFTNFDKFSKDEGDRIITPAAIKETVKYYDIPKCSTTR